MRPTKSSSSPPAGRRTGRHEKNKFIPTQSLISILSGRAAPWHEHCNTPDKRNNSADLKPDLFITDF